MPKTNIELSKSRNARKLTSKQKLFVVYMARLKMDICRAYHKAFYPGERKSQALELKIYKKATDLWADPRVQSLYTEECGKLDEITMFSRSQGQSMLAYLRDQAMDSGDIASAIRAEVKRGEMQGLYIKRFEKVKDDFDMATSAVELAKLIAESPEVMSQLAPEIRCLVNDQTATCLPVVDSVGSEISDETTPASSKQSQTLQESTE